MKSRLEIFLTSFVFYPITVPITVFVSVLDWFLDRKRLPFAIYLKDNWVIMKMKNK